ncbi:MAG: hypothetical protein A2142_02810 [candidate division Zixibacteria bacterium RBG_16_48_11]|nr:MAG: hypothetical protein A2142_02810 [candidate division Zixibacteria bacterium RBG_16_48_11]
MSRYPLYSKEGLTRARNLRKCLTIAERKLWAKLRDTQLGIRFRCQAPVGPFIVDFLSIKARLIVELDGSQHLRRSQADRDKRRTIHLKRQGYLVMRFDDSEYLKNSQAILQMIKEQIETRLQTYKLSKPHPTLPSQAKN